MTEIFIENLNPEQETLLLNYREKLRVSAFSTERIDKQKAKEAVKAVYAAMEIKQPEIIFFDSPYAAANNIINRSWRQLGKQVESKLKGEPQYQMKKYLELKISNQLRIPRWRLSRQLNGKLYRKLGRSFSFHKVQSFYEFWIENGIWFDFCISVLNCEYDQRLWKMSSLYQLLDKYCGWVFPYEKFCFVCERPIKVSIDNQDYLHAEGEPAMQFVDGYNLYAYHGLALPEKYGILHSHQWQAQWLLEEEKLDLRRVLIEGIGYPQIFSQLQAAELDTWQEYALSKTQLFKRLRISELLDRLNEHRHTTKKEFSKLWHSEENDLQGYTVWDRLEILSADIIGYASGISLNSKTQRRFREPRNVVAHLHKLSIFDVECIMKWYPTAAQEYPKIKHYFELLDYIRLLSIDYIQRYQLQEDLTAK